MVESRPPFLIGVAGGTASGKTSVCHKIIELLSGNYTDSGQRVVLLSQDSFYKNLTTEQSEKADQGLFNFDHPGAFDTVLMKQSLDGILARESVEIPVYDFKTHSRCSEYRVVSAADVVLLEGILVLYDPTVRALMNMKLFVDTDSDTRLSRRVLRDIQERGRNLEHVLNQYMKFVKPSFEEFTLPTKKYADVIIPRGVENTVAINLIVGHINDILAGTEADQQRPAPTAPRTRRIRRYSDSIQSRPH